MPGSLTGPMISSTIQPRLYAHEQALSDPSFIKTIADEIKEHVMQSLKENLNTTNLNPGQGEYRDPF
jgi:hypothetical protein